MRLSRFFNELRGAYEAELDDLMTDSGGHDVLADRLTAKRAQIPLLLPMLGCNPEMVAVAFHGGMRFHSPGVMRDLAAQEPEDLPSWSDLRSAVELAPWAEKLAETVLQNADGDQFLVVTACLEYLQGQVGAYPERPDRRPTDEAEEADDDEGDDSDLDEAGADWLSEQGFDRRDPFSGD